MASLQELAESCMELKFLDSITGNPFAGHHSREGMMTIGRSSRCDVVIPARDSKVSSHHATMSSIVDSLDILDSEGHRLSTSWMFIDG